MTNEEKIDRVKHLIGTISKRHQIKIFNILIAPPDPNFGKFWQLYLQTRNYETSIAAFKNQPLDVMAVYHDPSMNVFIHNDFDTLLKNEKITL